MSLNSAPNQLYLLLATGFVLWGTSMSSFSGMMSWHCMPMISVKFTGFTRTRKLFQNRRAMMSHLWSQISSWPTLAGWDQRMENTLCVNISVQERGRRVISQMTMSYNRQKTESSLHVKSGLKTIMSLSSTMLQLIANALWMLSQLRRWRKIHLQILALASLSWTRPLANPRQIERQH